jgi:hypothetical protein
MCDLRYESVYDSVYNLLPKVSSKVIFDLCMLKCADRPLLWVSHEELFGLNVNRARNGTAICLPIRTHGDGPLRGNILVCPFAEYVKRYGEGMERLVYDLAIYGKVVPVVFVVPVVVPAVMEAGNVLCPTSQH